MAGPAGLYWAAVAEDGGSLDGLERWAADARAREAAGARVRERWLRAQAADAASVAGLLLALAERRETVLVTTTAGPAHRGAATGVGLDFVALETPSGTTTLVTLASVAWVRVVEAARRPGVAAVGDAGDEQDRAALGVRLGDVLSQAAGQRPRVSVLCGTASIVGDLRAVGDDVVTIRADGAAGLAYVSLASLSAVSFLASG
ncbi:MAG TPA: hypothetical protein VHT97_01000 [Acidimicrobiales bacterium]|jgi:hypothetical protein|nr:hypothetical protein [Acidimicrobiales bacterium]